MSHSINLMKSSGEQLDIAGGTWKVTENMIELFRCYFFIFRITVSCIYTANATQSVVLHSDSLSKEPRADVGMGELTIQLRLSQGMSHHQHWHTNSVYFNICIW